MSTTNRWLRRLAFVLALAPLAMATLPSAARADGDNHYRRADHREQHDRGEHRGWNHDRGEYRDQGGYYYAPPPPVYYAPPPRPSAGINLFFPIR
ncbi:MAG: hypothetical protein JWO51_3175 [Rhodospirillales bacterium]|nr:hypothetical protein [Rhodospirillales bacterium]